MFKRTLLAASVALVPALGAAQTVDELQQQIDILAREIEELKTGQGKGGALDKLHIGGYGEHHYNNFFRDPEFATGTPKDDKVDAHRFVLFFGYDFSDKVRFFSELELEHSLAGEGKPGEVELEQAYIQIDTSASTKLTTGLFLIPVGILNETHEPNTFYGVERNRVESAIIPSTWWETGVMFSQDLGQGLSYDVAFHSGLEVDSEYGIRGGRQKSAEAFANDSAWTARLRYAGISGLDMAVSYQYQSDLHQSAPDADCTPGSENRGCDLGFAGEVPDAGAKLITAHARYSVGGLQLTALHARWDIDSNDAEALGRDEQEGYYLEAGYKVTEQVGIFARHTNVDTQAGDSADSELLSNTFGVNYWVLPQVVFKADYENVAYKNPAADDDRDDSINLGVGWSF